jgi:hypothetical protein
MCPPHPGPWPHMHGKLRLTAQEQVCTLSPVPTGRVCQRAVPSVRSAPMPHRGCNERLRGETESCTQIPALTGQQDSHPCACPWHRWGSRQQQLEKPAPHCSHSSLCPPSQRATSCPGDVSSGQNMGSLGCREFSRSPRGLAGEGPDFLSEIKESHRTVTAPSCIPHTLYLVVLLWFHLKGKKQTLRVDIHYLLIPPGVLGKKF